MKVFGELRSDSQSVLLRWCICYELQLVNLALLVQPETFQYTAAITALASSSYETQKTHKDTRSRSQKSRQWLKADFACTVVLGDF